MRALIISLIVLISILSFSVFNTIYINMKICDLAALTEELDDENLGKSIGRIDSLWKASSDYFRITVTDSKINPVEKAIEHLKQIANGAGSDFLTARSDLLTALGKISELVQISLIQIF